MQTYVTYLSPYYAQLGVSIAKEKTVESTTRLTFLGIELDIVQMRLLQDILGSMY